MEDIESQEQEMLPEEVEQLIALEKERIQDRIESIGKAVADKRRKAIDARKSSGIEEEWDECDDAYEGVDDANRSTVRVYKPLSPNGSPVFQQRSKASTRSTILLNITRPYTDGASARVGDMLLPTDDRNWSMRPTPIASGVQSMQPGSNGLPLPNSATIPSPNAPAIPAAPISAEDQADKVDSVAAQSVAKAQRQIDDWLVECNYHAEMRKVIEDCSRLGVGIIKGPEPYKQKTVRINQTPQGAQVVLEEKILPGSRRVSPRNFYPDWPACGEDIHRGSFVFERDDINGKKLKDLIGVPGYLSDQIQKVLEEGPSKKYEDNSRNRPIPENESFEIWYCYCNLEKEDFKACGLDVENEELEYLPAIVTLVNDSAIQVVLNPLDDGEFPYDAMPWQRREGHWAGIGVPRQIFPAQKQLTAANRNMMDNAGLSGGPIMAYRKGAIQPVDGDWNLAPRKTFFLKEDSDVTDIRQAIQSMIIPSNQMEMLNIINFALKVAEDITGLPMLMQGQQGSAPDTVGGMQIINNNAGTVLRRIARNYDDYITEKHIRRYHKYLMSYGEDESMKVEAIIDARGSTALVERDLQNQAIAQMGALVLNPAFGLSPSKWIKEFLKSQRFDPDRFTMDDQEKQQLAQRGTPEAPQVTVAKIRAQTDLQRTQMQSNAELQMAKMSQDRDIVYAQAQNQQTQIQANSRREELALKREIAYIQLQMKQGMNTENNKVRLAELSAKLRTQKELSVMGMKADIHKEALSPPTEPVGRANNGQAFTQ